MAALSPSSWWKFANDGTDAGSGGITLSAVGTPVYVDSLVPSQSAAASSAVQLDGSADYFTDGDNYGFETAFGSLKFSIAFWLKVESGTFASDSERIISKRNVGTPFAGWALHGSAGDNLGLLFDYGATEETWVFDTALTNGTTAFVVITVDTSVPRGDCYINGSLVSFDTAFTNTGTLPDTAVSLEVGAERGGNNKFQGILDELAIWDGRVLSGAEIAVLYAAGTSDYATEVLADSPRAYYRMNEASGLIQDSSGNAMHASTSAGTLTYEQSGAIASDPTSKSILFQPEGVFSIPDDPDLDVADIFTLECWFRFNTAGLTNRYILTKQTGAYELRVQSDDSFSLHKSDVSDTVDSTSAIPNDAAFHHLVCTKTGATVKQYLDGVDVTGTVSNSTYVDNTSPLRIGGYVGGTHIDAYLAEVAVYPTALSQARVQAHYDAAFEAEAVFGYQRVVGPMQLAAAAATLYTVPTDCKLEIRQIFANNPSGSPVAVDLSIGTDSAATKIIDETIPAGGELNLRRKANHTLTAGEVLQGFADSASTVVITINGVLEAL